jgi:hypothetical protein
MPRQQPIALCPGCPSHRQQLIALCQGRRRLSHRQQLMALCQGLQGGTTRCLQAARRWCLTTRTPPLQGGAGPHLRWRPASRRQRSCCWRRAALFLLFRPRPPDIVVAAVRLPAFATAKGTIAFTFEQTAVVRNPNRSPLAHLDSLLRVAYAGVSELGCAYILAGLINTSQHINFYY